MFSNIGGVTWYLAACIVLAITIIRGIGGMFARENVNSCAPYYILDGSQQERI